MFSSMYTTGVTLLTKLGSTFDNILVTLFETPTYQLIVNWYNQFTLEPDPNNPSLFLPTFLSKLIKEKLLEAGLSNIPFLQQPIGEILLGTAILGLIAFSIARAFLELLR